jgi:hypothetical protein
MVNDEDGILEISGEGNGRLVRPGRFEKRRDEDALQPAKGALGGGVELPERDDLVTAVFDAVRDVLPGRKDIDDAPSPRVFAPEGDQVYAARVSRSLSRS